MKLWDRIRKATAPALIEGEPAIELHSLDDIYLGDNANKTANKANKPAKMFAPKRARRPAQSASLPKGSDRGDAGDVEAGSTVSDAGSPSSIKAAEPAKRPTGRPQTKTDARSIAARERMRAKRAAAKGAQ